MKRIMAWVPSEQAVIDVKTVSAATAAYTVFHHAGGRPEPDASYPQEPDAAGGVTADTRDLHRIVPGIILLTYGTPARFEIISPDIEMVFSWDHKKCGHWFRRITKAAPEYESNWDLAYDPEYFSDHSGGVFSIARADSGASDSIYGDLKYLRKVLDKGYMNIEDLTEYGKSLIE